jgi:hypothetical protein
MRVCEPPYRLTGEARVPLKVVDQRPGKGALDGDPIVDDPLEHFTEVGHVVCRAPGVLGDLVNELLPTRYIISVTSGSLQLEVPIGFRD